MSVRFPIFQLRQPAVALAFGAVMAAMGPWAVTEARALDLLQSYQLALSQDANFQAAIADTQATRESEAMALGQLLPNVSASLSNSRNNTNSATPGFLGGRTFSTYEYDSSNYAVVLRQPLYRKYNFALYEQAQSQGVSAEATLDKSRQDLLVRLCGAYFEALMARHQQQLVQAQKEAYGGQVMAAKKAFSAGIGTRTDIDDAQARYDMTLAQELEANQNFTYTRQQLQVIVNQPVESMATLDATRMVLAPPTPANVSEWISRGEEINPELRATRANIESARQEVEKARAGHMPTVDLVVQRSRSLSANEVTINQFYLSTQVGVQVNIPMFAGGYVNASVRQATAMLEKYQQAYEAKRRDVGLQIRKEFQNVTEGLLKVRALEQADRSTEQAVFSNQKGFQAGTRTQIDILNAQQQRMNTRRDLAQARYIYVLARIRLLGLVGAIDESEIAIVNSWLTVSESAASASAPM